MSSGVSTPRSVSRLSQLNMKELLAEAQRLGVQLEGMAEREDIVWKLEEAIEQQNELPSETVGTWMKPQMKGYLLKDAVQSRSNTKKRYFTLMGNFLMYYENEKESVFHPKGVWCLDDCRVGMMKRPGLGEKQACLLRGKRELVITADSLEELKAWNKAVQQARKYTPARFAELERTSQAELAKLRRQVDSTIVELELTRSKLREEKQTAARVEMELQAARAAGATAQGDAAEAERRQHQLKADMDAEHAARDEAMRAALEAEAKRADAALAELDVERRARAVSNARRSAASEDAARLKAQIDELRGQLHREVEARQAADILKEAAIKAQMEQAESHADLRAQVAESREAAREAAAELERLQAEAQEAHEHGVGSPRELDAEEKTRRQTTQESIAHARLRSKTAAEEVLDAEARLAEDAEVAALSAAQILADLPFEMRRANGALRHLCARLKKIERPEATLLYADVMSTRAKLVHATHSWAD